MNIPFWNFLQKKKEKGMQSWPSHFDISDQRLCGEKSCTFECRKRSISSSELDKGSSNTYSLGLSLQNMQTLKPRLQPLILLRKQILSSVSRICFVHMHTLPLLHPNLFH